MKPTPGPWHYERDDHNPYIIDSTKMSRIADVYSPPYPVGRGLNEANANALRMAASPELFECVASFVRRFGAAVECDEEINGGDAVDWIGENMREFRNALKKAKGVS